MKLNIQIKNMSIIICAFIIFSCKSKIKKVEADLTFKSISFASAYDANNKQFEKLLNDVDSVSKIENSKLNLHGKLLKFYKKLNNHNLLRSPYIFLNFGNDSIMTLYLSEKEYNKVKDIKHIDLFKANKKVVLELEIEKKDSNIYYSNNIISISKIDGKSRSNIFKK